ncbi:MAG: hypothetical protein A2Y17_08155 [Clostridiales bacterium GWF2_38_85]|nr:MAG: hypothetical protein A2Y17_08155 [Clostridiales bacterium GWF2_38_85]HBL83835.1 hypothetical protein [Clostridiales bacterium]
MKALVIWSIYIGDTNIGLIGDSIFQIYDDNITDEYGKIYCYLRGNHVNWLDEYEEISKTNSTSTAITRVYAWWNNFSDTTSSYHNYSTGIVSYDKNLLKYIGIRFNEDILTIDQTLIIAKSIKLSSAD